MEIEQKVRDIKLDDIDEIEWLKIRQISNSHKDERDALHHLGLSMATQRATTPSQPASQHTPANWEDHFLSTPIGQLAPIRVIRYPHELKLSLPKDYGLVFGYRRVFAAKQQGLTTIQAQVIHLTPDEYRGDKIRLYLQLMAFAENAEREELAYSDYFKAIKRLKDKYEATYPESSKRFKHLTQSRDAKGHFGHTDKQAPSSFNKELRKIIRKNPRTIREDFQVGNFLTYAVLTERYKELPNKSASLVLSQIPCNQQIVILDQLVAQHLPFTIKNIEAAVVKYRQSAIGISDTSDRKVTVTADSAVTASPNKSNRLGHNGIQAPSTAYDTLPDLTIVATVINLCLDLRHRFTWTPTTTCEALPIFDDLLSASQILADYLRHEHAMLRKRTSHTAPQNNGANKGALAHAHHR